MHDKALALCVNAHNQNRRIFVRSASVEHILTKVAKRKEAFDPLHWVRHEAYNGNLEVDAYARQSGRGGRGWDGVYFRVCKQIVPNR